jgi:septal ring factor EnvC (AmiA/AmiB activator)
VPIKAHAESNRIEPSVNQLCTDCEDLESKLQASELEKEQLIQRLESADRGIQQLIQTRDDLQQRLETSEHEKHQMMMAHEGLRQQSDKTTADGPGSGSLLLSGVYRIQHAKTLSYATVLNDHDRTELVAGFGEEGDHNKASNHFLLCSNTIILI